ncbi:hypothetical protein ADL22_02545 [Streptomyces sp. NRRL F-4489]|nr:hypothetical protein ADL22_02545 [Streptomyces sp. NRRL F-4489]
MEAIEEPHPGCAAGGGAEPAGGRPFGVVEDFLDNGDVHGADGEVPGEAAGERGPTLQGMDDQGFHGFRRGVDGTAAGITDPAPGDLHTVAYVLTVR